MFKFNTLVTKTIIKKTINKNKLFKINDKNLKCVNKYKFSTEPQKDNKNVGDKAKNIIGDKTKNIMNMIGGKNKKVEELADGELPKVAWGSLILGSGIALITWDLLMSKMRFNRHSWLIRDRPEHLKDKTPIYLIRGENQVMKKPLPPCCDNHNDPNSYCDPELYSNILVDFPYGQFCLKFNGNSITPHSIPGSRTIQPYKRMVHELYNDGKLHPWVLAHYTSEHQQTKLKKMFKRLLSVNPLSEDLDFKVLNWELADMDKDALHQTVDVAKKQLAMLKGEIKKAKYLSEQVVERI